MKKIGLFCLSLLLMMGCDDHIHVYFEQAISGRSAARLVGTYLLPNEEPDSVEYSTLTFSKLAKKEYAIMYREKKRSKMVETDTLYMGEIVRRGDDYFMNIPVEKHPWLLDHQKFSLGGR